MSFSLICDENDGAVLDAIPRSGPKAFRFLLSERLSDKCPPEGLTMKLSPNFPEHRTLYDFVNNLLDIRFVSDRVRRVVMELAPDDVEFIPLTLLDHQKDVLSRDYFVMNVVADRDVVDLERSKVEMGEILPEEIERVWDLKLKEDLPPEGPRIFRPKHLRIYTMVDPTMQAALASAGVTGVRFFPANGWNGKFY